MVIYQNKKQVIISIHSITVIKNNYRKRRDRMLTPTKNIHEDQSIVKVGARILSFLSNPKTVNLLWKKYDSYQSDLTNIPKITYDIFILGLNFLFIINAIEYRDGIIWRRDS